VKILLAFVILNIAIVFISIMEYRAYRLEQERIQKLEEEFLKKFHHKHKLKKPGEINEL
jgi:cell division protein FtsL